MGKKRGKINICRLCLNEKPLCDSHIIPELFYKSTYGQNHHFVQMSKGVQFKRQTGIFERLLCNDCEKYLNENYEQYAALILNKISIDMLQNQNNTIITDIDYRNFKLFLLSIIWRMGVSQRLEFSKVKLGTKHEEKLREMIISCNPGEPYDYPCLIIHNTAKNDVQMEQFIVAPEKAPRFQSHLTYKVFMASFMWVFIVSSHTNKIIIPMHLWLDHRGLIIHKIQTDPNKFLYNIFHGL